jgi:uncharacterized cupredoxin-like copper-binding protein
MIAVAAMTGLSGCSSPPRAESPVVDVSLGNYFFHGPDTIPAGYVTFRLNLVGSDAHVMDLFRLDQGKRLKDLLAVGESALDSSWVTPVGGGVTAEEGNSPRYSLHLVPGHYIMLCYFETNHVPHFANGMVKEFDVVGAEQAAEPAVADVRVELVDYGYNFSAPIAAGRRTLRVVNPSTQGHEMIVSRLKDGFTLAQAQARADSADPKGPSPWEQNGGVGDLAAGDSALMTVNFKPGTYRIFCYFRVNGDSLNHYQHGMHRIITVD